MGRNDDIRVFNKIFAKELVKVTRKLIREQRKQEEKIKALKAIKKKQKNLKNQQKQDKISTILYNYDSQSFH